MNKKIKNEVGNRYGKLIVVSYAGSRKKSNGALALWECKCDCGNTKTVSGDSLRTGNVSSCGCYRESGDYTRKHGHSNSGGLHKESKTYRSWTEMRARTTNENHISYKNYGAKGIVVCDRWKDFSLFLADMGERPDGHSLDRIDSNGNYEPDNCRWSDRITQNNNRSQCHLLTHMGRTQTLAQWCRELGVSYMKAYKRLMSNKPIEHVLATY